MTAPHGCERGRQDSEMPAESAALAGAFVGPFDHLAERVRVSRDGVPPAVPIARLLERPTFGQVLNRYARRFGGSDRRAVASLWSQYCFGSLITPFVAASLLGGRTLPVTLDSVGLVLEEGQPSGLDLPHAGRPAQLADAFERFEPLFRGQIAPLIDRLADHSGASPRLFWCNAAVIFDWAVRQAATVRPAPHDPEPFRHRLLDSPTWPDGQPNPLYGAFRPPAGSPEQPQRRVCCVRYILPGVPGCGPYCPLDR